MNKMIFHVHTWRCGHAENVSDEEYIKKAIELGAEQIVFTDHAPLPGDLFTGRMKSEQLAEYITTLQLLKHKYYSDINIVLSLEIEYLPSYVDYIYDLKKNKDIDILILGQHFYELSNGEWSFNLHNKNNEWKGLINAEIEAARSGLFDVIAHPDRVFKRCKSWSAQMKTLSNELIKVSCNNKILLEKNFSSKKCKRYYWEEFWKLVSDRHVIIYGSDAHSLDELVICDKSHFETI